MSNLSLLKLSVIDISSHKHMWLVIRHRISEKYWLRHAFQRSFQADYESTW